MTYDQLELEVVSMNWLNFRFRKKNRPNLGKKKQRSHRNFGTPGREIWGASHGHGGRPGKPLSSVTVTVTAISESLQVPSPGSAPACELEWTVGQLKL